MLEHERKIWERRIRLQIEKDKALFMIIIGVVFIIIGITELIMWIKVLQIF